MHAQALEKFRAEIEVTVVGLDCDDIDSLSQILYLARMECLAPVGMKGHSIESKTC